MSTELPLEATDEEFSTFLRETCGIETNSFTVRQARTAAKGHTDLWKDVCERWDREPKSLVDKCLGPWARRVRNLTNAGSPRAVGARSSHRAPHVPGRLEVQKRWPAGRIRRANIRWR